MTTIRNCHIRSGSHVEPGRCMQPIGRVRHVTIPPDRMRSQRIHQRIGWAFGTRSTSANDMALPTVTITVRAESQGSQDTLAQPMLYAPWIHNGSSRLLSDFRRSGRHSLRVWPLGSAYRVLPPPAPGFNCSFWSPSLGLVPRVTPRHNWYDESLGFESPHALGIGYHESRSERHHPRTGSLGQRPSVDSSEPTTTRRLRTAVDTGELHFESSAS